MPCVDTIAQRLNDFKAMPQYDIRGSITQFDEDVTRKQAALRVSLLPSLCLRPGGQMSGVAGGRTDRRLRNNGSPRVADRSA